MAQEPQFKTHAREVLVPVSVTTPRGQPVENLTAGDFVVLDSGKAQTVHIVAHDSAALPIYAVLVLQTDVDSEPALAKIKKMASTVGTYITNDMDLGMPSLAAVVTASDEVKLAQPFTADSDILGDTFARIQAKGDSARLIDGVNLACDLLAKRKEPARRVIVLIGESHDLGSGSKFQDVLVKAQRDDVVIYSLYYSPFLTAFTQKASDRPPPPDQPGLYDPSNHGGINLLAIPALLVQLAKLNVSQAFAQATGGSHEKFLTFHNLERQLTAIGTEIHNRYTLTFVPSDQQRPGYHQLSVTVRNSEKWTVHARAGYWSATSN